MLCKQNAVLHKFTYYKMRKKMNNNINLVESKNPSQKQKKNSDNF